MEKEKTVKMVNKWGHEFECPESDIERYVKICGAKIIEPKQETKPKKESSQK